MTSKQIRLTNTSYAVLTLLDLLGAATPYDLKQALERSIENFWPVPHSTFYAEPARLARGGYLSVQQEAGGRRRKLYALTDDGRRVLAQWASEPDCAPPQLRDEGELKIFAGADPVPIARARADWHRAKLTELEGYLQRLGEGEQWQGVRACLLAGITYHRQLLQGVERFLQENDAGGQPPGAPSGDLEGRREAQAATGTS
jgi:PadR family transcriptional regulator, regulatory protein AphA